MITGTIRSFDYHDLWGWLTPHAGGPDVPIDPRSLVSTERKILTVGEEVSYDLVPGARGLEAANVRRPVR